MRKTTPRVSEAAHAFITQRFARSGSRQQRYGYRSMLARFAEDVNDCQVGSLTPGHVEDFFYGVNGLHLTCQRTTLGKYRGDMKAFLGWCHRRGYLGVHADIMLDGITDKSTRQKRPRTRLEPHELLSLLSEATCPRDRALLAFVMNTATRISEAMAMRVEWVNLDRGEMKVYIQKTNTWDMMPITADLDVELRTWLTHYHSVSAPSKDAYLFPARGVSRYTAQGPGQRAKPVVAQPFRPGYRINNPALILKPIAKRAGIEFENGDGWHTIRRSIARIYFDNASAQGHDAALRETAALLHHENTETTERYLGLELERRNRDEVLRGKPFLTKLVSDSNVVPITRAKEG